MSSQHGQPVIAEIEAASVAAHAIDRLSPVSFAASASKSAGEIMLREAVGETPQQGATAAHSKVGKGHCRSGAPSNSNSRSAPLSSLEPRSVHLAVGIGIAWECDTFANAPQDVTAVVTRVTRSVLRSIANE
jgi:hypothetical protein